MCERINWDISKGFDSSACYAFKRQLLFLPTASVPSAALLDIQCCLQQASLKLKIIFALITCVENIIIPNFSFSPLISHSEVVSGFQGLCKSRCQRLSIALFYAGRAVLFLEMLRYLVVLILILKLEGDLGGLR